MINKQFGAMFKARTMEFVRDRGTLIWNLVFPVILVFGFAFAITGNDKLFKVGVFGGGSTAEIVAAAGHPGSGVPAILADEQVQLVRYNPQETPQEVVLKRLSQHQIEMLIDLDSKQYWLNPESPKSRLLKRLFNTEQAAVQGATETTINHGASANEPIAAGHSLDGYTEQIASGKAVRYVDWLVPGAIGMNMMFSCLFGVGFVIVRYRKNGVLKRLKATPVSALNFVIAQGASRFVIVLATAILVYVGTNAILHFTMNGSYLLLLLVTAMAIVAMIALGLVFAARFKSEELANGLMNLVTFPMMVLSGVFFSLEGQPDVVQKVALAFPLTHFTEASRKIMLDGAGLAAISPNLLYLGVASIIFISVAAWLFKWE